MRATIVPSIIEMNALRIIYNNNCSVATRPCYLWDAVPVVHRRTWLAGRWLSLARGRCDSAVECEREQRADDEARAAEFERERVAREHPINLRRCGRRIG